MEGQLRNDHALLLSPVVSSRSIVAPSAAATTRTSRVEFDRKADDLGPLTAAGGASEMAAAIAMCRGAGKNMGDATVQARLVVAKGTRKNLTHEALENLRSVFDQFDADGSGSLQHEEMYEVLAELGITGVSEELVDLLMSEIDKDGNGEVDFNEFVEFHTLLIGLLQTAPQRHNGRIRMGELVELLQRKDMSNDGEMGNRRGMTRRQHKARARINEMLYNLEVFSPDHPYRRSWDVLMLICVCHFWIVGSLMCVLSITPFKNEWQFVGYVDLLFSAGMVLDVFIRLNTAVRSSYGSIDLITDRAGIARRYFYSGGLPTDLLSGIPFDMLSWLLLSDMTTWRWLRGLRVIGVLKLPRLFQMTDRVHMDSAFVRFYFRTVPLMKLMAQLVIGLHALAIGRLIVQLPELHRSCEAHSAGPDSCISDYFYALFWVWALLTTQGIAPLESATVYAYATLVMLFSLLLQGHIVAHMSALVLKSNVVAQNQESMRSTLAIMEHYQVPPLLQEEVLSFQYHSLQQDAAIGAAHILDRLPGPMQREVGLYVRVDLVARVPMFGMLSAECKLDIAGYLHQVCAEPEQYIVRHNEHGSEMFFMMHGFADVIVPEPLAGRTQGKIIGMIKRGDFFGESALLNPDKRRLASVQALTYCDLFTLHCDDVTLLQGRYPELKRRIEQEARKRGLRNQRRRSRTEILDQDSVSPSTPTESAFGGFDYPGSLRTLSAKKTWNRRQSVRHAALSESTKAEQLRNGSDSRVSASSRPHNPLTMPRLSLAPTMIPTQSRESLGQPAARVAFAPTPEFGGDTRSASPRSEGRRSVSFPPQAHSWTMVDETVEIPEEDVAAMAVHAEAGDAAGSREGGSSPGGAAAGEPHASTNADDDDDDDDGDDEDPTG
eukprot:TRINITY_DN9190_c1_g1_i1.p1 TRINITY_DN9190_c1_g1~~TRINITY_DN9190_c1_g1_i1.p1  ORF type:complete len:906 (+),score=170.64 TRINITY_DN9190_c1_g1_i1:54-2720(+)